MLASFLCPRRWVDRTEGTKPWAKGQLQYLRLHHVDSPGPKLSDTVVDVHHSFPFCHVQHDIDDYEAARPPCPSTARKEADFSKGKGPSRRSYVLKSTATRRSWLRQWAHLKCCTPINLIQLELEHVHHPLCETPYP